MPGKRKRRDEYPCPTCNEWQNIDALLRNAPAARPSPLEALVANYDTIKDQLERLDARILSQVDAGFNALMRTLTDEAKEGPRLFSFEPVDPGFFVHRQWVSEKFRLTLWCEHSRLPLPALNAEGDTSGVYEVDIPREWFVKSAPTLKLLFGALSL